MYNVIIGRNGGRTADWYNDLWDKNNDIGEKMHEFLQQGQGVWVDEHMVKVTNANDCKYYALEFETEG
jgi:hypothetical protein